MPTNSYRTLFFDLDHTLWDYETNARDTLLELYDSYALQASGVSNFNEFHLQFMEVNGKLWHLYDHGKIDSEVIRKERFKMILAQFKIADERLSLKLSEDYLYVCPRKGHLMPHALQTLEYLSGSYSLTVITNGFDDIQRIKLEAGNITDFFTHIITSQKAGHKKPAREIFQFAMDVNAVSPANTVMIGDNLLTDIAGAKNASIDSIFFNPDKLVHQEKVTHEIHSLHELCSLL